MFDYYPEEVRRVIAMFQRAGEEQELFLGHFPLYREKLAKLERQRFTIESEDHEIEYLHGIISQLEHENNQLRQALGAATQQLQAAGFVVNHAFMMWLTGG